MTLKHLTKSILCSLLWAALPAPSLSAPVTMQDPITPQTVTLSDGRKVPLGVAGTICSNECVETLAIALPDDPTSRRWLWLFLPLGGAVALLTLLPPDSSTPNTPVDPPAPVPETGTLLLLCAGLLLLSVKLKKELQ